MIDSFYTSIDNISNCDLGVSVKERIFIPMPTERVITTPRNGGSDLHQHTGIYEDVEFTVKYNFYEKLDCFEDKWRNFKRWILKSSGKKFSKSDDESHFYIIINSEMSYNSRQEIAEFGETEIKFTVRPYAYLWEGTNEVDIKNTPKYYNQYEKTNPIFKIEGEGNINIILNGKTYNINVGQSVTIDVEKGRCYKNGELIPLALRKGYIKDMVLEEGLNTFNYSVSDGYINKIIMIPNLKEL